MFWDLFWYLLLIVCHLLWGLFPVSCRFLQTKAEPPLESMRLGFYVAALAALGLFFTYTIPVSLIRCCRRREALEHDGTQVHKFRPSNLDFCFSNCQEIVRLLQLHARIQPLRCRKCGQRRSTRCLKRLLPYWCLRSPWVFWHLGASWQPTTPQQIGSSSST